MDNNYGRLFVLRGDDCIYVPASGVYSVNIIPDNVECWVCGYCGSHNLRTLKCNHCNAPRKARNRNGDLTIQGYLPIAQILDELKDNFALHIMNNKCSDPRAYDYSSVVLIGKHCKVESKYIDCMVAMTPDENEVISLNLNVNCILSLRFESGKK